MAADVGLRERRGLRPEPKEVGMWCAQRKNRLCDEIETGSVFTFAL